MRTAEPALFAVVLAAGQSLRFGSIKQLAKVHGRPLVAGAMREAEAVCGSRSVLVTGSAAALVHAAAAPLSGFLVHNDRFGDGMSTSLGAAVSVLADVADAVLLMLADQPLVDRDHLADLKREWLRQQDRIVASRYGGTLGVPAILPSSQFAGLLALRGDQGARSLIAAANEQVVTVDFEPAAIDIDDPADIARITNTSDS